MLSRDITPGVAFMVREPGSPHRKVKAIERVRAGKWRVEFVDEEPPLTDYVKAAHIVCPWREHHALLRDEGRMKQLSAVTRTLWPGADHPTDRAVSWVLESTGEPDLPQSRGYLILAPDAWVRLCERAGLAEIPDEYRVVFTDRHGLTIAPWTSALELAKSFATAEPETVLRHIDECERTLNLESLDPGSSSLLRILEAYRPGFALVRSWAGFDEALRAKDGEIKRLRYIVDRTIVELRHSGAESSARQIERLLRGG